MSDVDPHPLLRFRRRDAEVSEVVINPGRSGPPVSRYILGNFFEHLSYATQGGVSAELLNNATFSRDHNLRPAQLAEFIGNGRALVELYLASGDLPSFDQRWVSTPLATGFGVAILDEALSLGIPLGWTPIGYPGGAGASVGRLGGAVRIRGGAWGEHSPGWTSVEDGPAGVRQGVFLPIGRVRRYEVGLWVRIASRNAAAGGRVEVGLRRRVATTDGRLHAGESLASARIDLAGTSWQRLITTLEIDDGAIRELEPVDFVVRWIPSTGPDLDLIIDRASLMPADHVGGLDHGVIEFVRRTMLPRLRWPGGNFASYYHWRDGIGPTDLRPTGPNRAWGGLDYNVIGTDEFIAFCTLIDAEPHITVNSGTASADEAADWVEYCNGSIETRMGALRAANGHPEPYGVQYWEVGNENFGFWQGGFVGSEENARRFAEFARAMRAASPIGLQLLACGNNFDFAIPGPAYDHVTADQGWHDALIAAAPDEVDLVSLHALPVNDQMLESVGDEQAHEAVLAQVTTWERRFLPDLLARFDAARSAGREPVRLAMTEWGPLGQHPTRLMVENFGGVVYAGTFLNFLVRNSERVPMASPNGFMHGGAFRKAAGILFMDPLVTAMGEYEPFLGTTPLECRLTGPGYDVPVPADLGAVDTDIPYIDVVACRGEGERLHIALANRHLSRAMEVIISLVGGSLPRSAELRLLSHPRITARANPAAPDRFTVGRERLTATDGAYRVVIPPFSVAWLTG